MFLLNSIGLGHLCHRLATLRQRGFELPLDSMVDNFSHFPSLLEYGLTGWLCAFLTQWLNLPGDTAELGEWCFGMLRRLQCNAHAITEINTQSGDLLSGLAGFEQERIGGGMFPGVSLINHACEPNIEYQFEVGDIILSTYT